MTTPAAPHASPDAFALPYPADHAPADHAPAAAGEAAPAPILRHDGWTPDRQRLFLESLAEGHSVEAACRIVGMSHQSAYAFRRRAGGQAFALGWAAARLIARESIADALLVRAIDGQVETITRDDGRRVERHRYDNRLAAQMLHRLDRLAEDQAKDGTHALARAAAAQFDAYLDSLPGQCLADADGNVPAPQLPQLCLLGALGPRAADQDEREDDYDDEDEDDDDNHPDGPVWWCEVDQCWKTCFPAPPGARVREWHDYGDSDYARTCTKAELAVIEARQAVRLERQRAEETAERDLWFASDDDAPGP